MGSWVFLAILAVIVIYIISLYNKIIRMKQTRDNAFSDIDVQLKERHNLIPNLVNTVKGYAEHEESILTAVTEARSSAMKTGDNVDDVSKAESVLGTAMMNLMAVAENYPDLKADQNFAKLQDELSHIEQKIAAARRFFNSATKEYNISIQSFPSVVVANMFKFGEESFFEMDAAEKELAAQPPEVSFS
mgnify:CR=1 FL=1|jgi:LemA protein|tara:strand:- start:233561 stop:234127 length:567 start_codon:yes stop_codon:yes gene_type:complete